MPCLRKTLNGFRQRNAKVHLQRSKKDVTSDLSLRHFNPILNIVVAADASYSGIGSVIFQEYENRTTKSIEHASRSLIAVKKKYNQIKKRTLAIILAMEKIHKFLHGRLFLIQTGHRLLMCIYGSKKCVPTHRANRLQRWGTMLLNYNYKMKFYHRIKYVMLMHCFT